MASARFEGILRLPLPTLWVGLHEHTYGLPYAETHHIDYLRNGRQDTLENMIVLCPNHHRLVHATNAHVDREALAYIYPNGIYEVLQATDHFRLGPAPSTSTTTER
jgi:hypothetical protein